MDYETAVQVFFQPAPEGTPTPYPVAKASPARRLRDACEPLGIHAAWSRRTNERLADRQADPLSGLEHAARGAPHHRVDVGERQGLVRSDEHALAAAHDASAPISWRCT